MDKCLYCGNIEKLTPTNEKNVRYVCNKCIDKFTKNQRAKYENINRDN